MESPVVNLPEDIVPDILVRLPVKSLVRFQSVSKSWLSLISSHKFAITHLNRMTSKSSSSFEYSMYGAIETRNFPRPHIFLHIFFPKETSQVELYLPQNVLLKPYHPFHADVLGSCNGMLLIGVSYVGMNFILWNPTTRVFKMLPDFGFLPLSFRCYAYGVGLGYSSSIDNYKVVVALHDKILQSSGSFKLEAFVYNLKTNSWSQLETKSDFPYQFLRDEPGTTVVNGAPHWIMKRRTNNNGGDGDEAIVYFDLVEEEFKELPSPPPPENSNSSTRRVSVGCFGENLCASRVESVNGESRIEVFLMKEYGVKESWVKLMKLPMDDPWLFNSMYMRSLSIARILNSEMLLLDLNRKALATFNPGTRILSYVFVMKDVCGFRVASYKQSLVSPNNSAI